MFTTLLPTNGGGCMVGVSNIVIGYGTVVSVLMFCGLAWIGEMFSSLRA